MLADGTAYAVSVTTDNNITLVAVEGMTSLEGVFTTETSAAA